MTVPVTDPLTGLRAAVVEATARVRGGGDAPAPRLERSKRDGQGDYSTNAAMLLAPALGSPPREIAGVLAAEIGSLLGDELDHTEVAGPGFLNMFLSDAWHRRALASILGAGSHYGAGGAQRPERILVEFVSANPTGPLVAASGRHAAYGDALARILAHHGHDVGREYYFNDAGGQIRRLGASVAARARGEEPPEDGYQGEYVAGLAAQIPGAATGDVDQVAGAAVELLLAQIKATLHRYGVEFDLYFSEGALHEGSPSDLERALEKLQQSGHVYTSEGALWLRTTALSDDPQDRVLARSGGGEPTYFAADVAYMVHKRERGFDRLLSPMGADHHGYVPRLKAAYAALGEDPDLLEVPIIQFMHLVAGGSKQAFTKRGGVFVTLDDLLDEIGVDATRFFMLQRSHDRTLDLDVRLAASQSAENPVYYVQYAHARIASMLAKAGADHVDAAVDVAAGSGAGAAALHPAERALIKKLASFPDEIAEAAERRAPHRIAGYALELAQEFTAFYRDCKVVGAEGDGVESFRITLCVAAKTTIELSLSLLGVSAPDSM